MAELEITNDPQEADRRFQVHKDHDPLPAVPSSLLNGHDIFEYVRHTGMVCPFEREFASDKLKVASYQIGFLGDVYETDEGGTPLKSKKIVDNTPYLLRKNSIAFIYLETVFRLPSYIAVRFNLQIKHVHRGLLLGTGPLVDPGFKGRLLIPLHNLTANDYIFIGGEGFIWVEFTKLPAPPPGGYSSPAEKSAAQYFAKATGGSVPRSSLPEVILSARNDARRAKRYAQVLTAVGVVGVLGLLLGLASLVGQTRSDISTARKETSDLELRLDQEAKTVQARAHERMEELKARIEKLERSRSQPPPSSPNAPARK